MADITVNNLVKTFEIGNPVLNGLSFSVNPGEHVAILGRNGCGKTTLFRILTGEYDYDEGLVSVASGKRLGLISQIPVVPDGWTTEDVLRSALARLDKIQKRMRELEKLMEVSSDRAFLNEYDRLLASFQQLGGYQADAEVNRIANGLDISEELRQKEFAVLSGGEKTRLNLARLILEDTDILLLDEPTNHLDMHATEWLEEYVSHFPGTVLAVSHDRYFLDRVAQRCIEISDGKAEFYSGNYSFFVEERQRRFNERMKIYERNAAKIAQLEKASDQMRLWAFMGNDKLYKRAFSMEKRIEKLRQNQPDRPTQGRKLSAKFQEADFTGDEVLVASGLSKSFGEQRLFADLDLEIRGGESIAVTGDNGSGKTTLLRILLGEEPADSGFIYTGPQIKAAYLPQQVRFQEESRSLYDTMLWECRCTPQDARDRLAAFGFRGEFVFNPVSVLSGGERSRLKLCMLMGGSTNFLILDEPTNHLDIASREWIEDAISRFDKTLLFVSHDRYFIDRFATRIITFEGDGRVTDYPGTYREYLDYRDRLSLYERQAASAAEKREKTPAPPVKKQSQSKTLAKTEREIEKLEAEIAALKKEEEEKCDDYVALMDLESKVQALEEKLEPLYELWESLSE